MTIYLTGMGATTPQVDAGLPGPSQPAGQGPVQPSVTLGGTSSECIVRRPGARRSGRVPDQCLGSLRGRRKA